jgi:hypothetical protein
MTKYWLICLSVHRSNHSIRNVAHASVDAEAGHGSSCGQV